MPILFVIRPAGRRNGTLAHDQVVGIVVCIYTEPLTRGVGKVNVVLKSESLSSDEWWSCSRLLLNVLLIVILLASAFGPLTVAFGAGMMLTYPPT